MALTAEDIEQIINEIILSTSPGLTKENLNLNTQLDSLGMDSLDVVTTTMFLEIELESKDYNLKIPTEEIRKLETVGALARYAQENAKPY